MRTITFLRSLLVTFIFPFTVLFLGPLAMLLQIFFGQGDVIVSFWGRLCCWMSGIEVNVEGLENIPDEGCLFLFNHSSFFDIFALVGYIPHIRFGAKAELFKIPVFSHAMRAMGTLPIARNNRDEVFKIYEEAKQRFALGERFALSPEGGRFYGRELSPFKSGPFIFAMSAEAPVVPTLIFGAYEALPKGAMLFNRDRFRHRIDITILPFIPTRGYSEEQRKDLQAIVYEQMNSVWMSKNGISP